MLQEIRNNQKRGELTKLRVELNSRYSIFIHEKVVFNNGDHTRSLTDIPFLLGLKQYKYLDKYPKNILKKIYTSSNY